MKTVIFTFYTHKTRSEQRLVGHFFVVNFSSKIEKGYRLSMLFARIYMSVKSLKTKVCPTLALLVFSDFKEESFILFILCFLQSLCTCFVGSSETVVRLATKRNNSTSPLIF